MTNNKSEKQDAKMFDFKCIMAPLERFAIVRDAINNPKMKIGTPKRNSNV